jgi:LDH2 family malate/lactate/ureidoglycolate dehydrogenase
MKVGIEEARALLQSAMRKINFTTQEADIIADHLLDCELRGVTIGGLSRALSIIERYGEQPVNRPPIQITRETASSAAIEGGDTIGYLVGRMATELAIRKARDTGIGVVGAHCAIFSGMLCYYAEMVTREQLVCLATSSTGPFVAPEGGTEPRFGTNPIAFGFPSAGEPVIWDIGTSQMMIADAALAKRLGRPLDPNKAFDASGRPTTDPDQALQGAFRVWGGHKGSGLALSVQLLGMLCGAQAMPDRFGGIGFFLMVLDPGILVSAETFRQEVEAYVDAIRSTRAEDPSRPVRMPFDRSRALRVKTLQEGAIEVPVEVLDALRGFVEPRK